MMGSEQNRFLQHERRKKWGGCWGGFSCFGTQKGGKRVVPASRTPDGNAPTNQPNGPQAARVANQATALAPSLLAPPSSPASFTNSVLPSTAQSPNCLLSSSANSPMRPSSTMFATGPYAHETQLVSPPVFSTFTTEPSTAPLTPPPELAHLTTPSSPDVPYARFLSSSAGLKCAKNANYVASDDLRASYPLSPRSPPSGLISPVSRTRQSSFSPEKELSAEFDPSHPSKNAKFTGGPTSQDSNFFCPATFAQFYLDQSATHSGGRLSISRDSDAYRNAGNMHQSWQNKNYKQEAEETEAYRQSFGFSADEMITTPQYVEISDVMDDSFTIMPYTSDKANLEESALLEWGSQKARKFEVDSTSVGSMKSMSDQVDKGMASCSEFEDDESERRSDDVFRNRCAPCNHILMTDEEDNSCRGTTRNNRKYKTVISCSDAEIDYRRATKQSSRERRGALTRQPSVR